MALDEYDAIEEHLAHELMTDLIRAGTSSDDLWDEAHAVVWGEWDKMFEGVPESDIVEAANPSNFRMLEWVDSSQNQPESAIREIAKGAVIESLVERMEDSTEPRRRAILIHDTLDRLCVSGGEDVHYTTDAGWPNPTMLVDAFFDWMNDQQTYVDDPGHPRAVIDKETVESVLKSGYNSFNESHVRQADVLSPLGNPEVLVGLAEWLETVHDISV